MFEVKLSQQTKDPSRFTKKKKKFMHYLSNFPFISKQIKKKKLRFCRYRLKGNELNEMFNFFFEHSNDWTSF